MASNRFGTHFCITTWGESHGKAIGVVIDGCPAGLAITESEINTALEERRPGRALTSERNESDQCEILSGVFEGKTTGTPISLIIYNRDAQSSDYSSVKNVLRPGHAHFTYLEKYGVFDYRGGGRSSGRETACRVAAGAVAEKLLKNYHIQLTAYLSTLGEITVPLLPFEAISQNLKTSKLFCPCQASEQAMTQTLSKLKKEGDSTGGVVTFIAQALPVGLGDPVYEKLEANLAKAMLSIPASKGFELGKGFEASQMRGSQHNDSFTLNTTGQVVTTTNHAGGTLGGISTGMPLICKVAFKPTSTIRLMQQTLDTEQKPCSLSFSASNRHDPALVVRAVPVVKAMGALVLADALLMNQITHHSISSSLA